MLTIKKMLNLPFFANFRLLAGENGINNEIHTTNIMDNPDALDWFSPNELLLTSGYFFKDSEQLQLDLIKTLVSLNCPGLCIKTKRYFAELPEKLLSTADALGLPIIEVPYGISFSSIMNTLRPHFSEEDHLYYQFAHDIHLRMSALAFNNAGFKPVTQTLQATVENPIIITDAQFKVIDQFIDANSMNLNELIIDQYFSEAFIFSLLEVLPENFEEFQHPLFRNYKIENSVYSYFIYPIRIPSVHYGYIFVFCNHRSLSSLDFLAIEESALTYALIRHKQNEIERIRNRAKRDFLIELLTGKIQDKSNIDYFCRAHSINPTHNTCSAILRIEDSSPKIADPVSMLQEKSKYVKRILGFLDKITYHDNVRFHYISSQGEIIIIMTSPATNSISSDFRDAIQFLFNTLLENFEEKLFKLYVGEVSKDIYQLNGSYRKANETIKLHHSITEQSNIVFYDDYILFHFLKDNIDKVKMINYFQATLGPLLVNDNKYNNDLINTLDVWINCNFNYSQTARTLFTHRNTVIYRLKKVSSLLNVDLTNPSDMLKYHLALKMRHLIADNR